MIIVPAIDIMGGRVVRLAQGDFDKVTTYDLSAVDFAKKWEAEGAKFLHIVDLDGAKSGEPKNKDVIKKIVKAVNVPFEVGGGIRTIESIREYLEMGVSRVVMSTKFLENPSFIYQKDLDAFAGQMAISIDIKKIIEDPLTKQLSLATGSDAWVKELKFTPAQDLKKIIIAGIRYINFSDISRDGMMQGLDIEKIKNFLILLRKFASEKLFFTYAGGVSTLDDIKALKKLGSAGVDAAIVGRALYENKFSLKEALEIC